jgi:hypothetical protein
MKTMRTPGTIVVLCVCLLAAAGTGARAQSFDGITIIELVDEAGENAILGRGLGPTEFGNNLIVTFVTQQGSYATLTGGNRQCVAWSVEGSYTGKSITFGVPPTKATTGHPKICQPFTLTYQADGTVQVDAHNKFHKSQGPLSEAAEIVSYSRQRKVVARIPLVPLDWGLPIFDRHAIKGVRLGPVPVVQAALGGARTKVGKLRRQTDFQKDFEAILEGQPTKSGQIVIRGRIAAAEIMGWPWDVLYGAWLQERATPTATETFEQAAFDRQGKESLRRNEGKFLSTRETQLLWLYDLAGQQIMVERNEAEEPIANAIARAARPDNCLATADLWLDNAAPTGINQDIGPWGCILIMILTHNGQRGEVGEYRIESVSGYTLALNHFFTRLEELRETRQKIGMQDPQSTP